MKYRTEMVRVGELLGPVDWTHDFLDHFSCHCTDDENKKTLCERAKERLKLLESEGPWEARQGDWWHDVLAVGMYDGWPYWKPVPSVLLKGHMGSEWHCFSNINAVRKLPNDKSLTPPQETPSTPPISAPPNKSTQHQG